MEDCQEFLNLLSAISCGVRDSHHKVLEEWLPEQPPVTTLFAALGYRVVEDFDSNSPESNRSIFALVEEAMKSGEATLVTAVATGFIEALVTRAVQVEDLWTRIAPLLGPSSREHADAWLST